VRTPAAGGPHGQVDRNGGGNGDDDDEDGLRSAWRVWCRRRAQACNDDTSSYDESFVDVVVNVSPPREPEPKPDDQIVAEDTPVEVVVVVVAVDGSTVTGAFTMPAL
jgi:hypothetical protein